MLAVQEIKVCDKESGEITDKNIKPHWSSKIYARLIIKSNW